MVQAAESNGQLSLHGLSPGRAGVQIAEAGGATRFVGVRVREAAGALPGLPPYVAIGSVSEDTAPDLDFWRGFGDGPRNRRIDVRYIYLNGGPFLGWSTWTAQPGDRARNYIRESRRLGIVPFFVYYNIPDGGESYTTDLQHVQDPVYMSAYFLDLQLALQIAAQEGGDDVVGFIYEPDFLGYMSQNHPTGPQQALARVDAAYSSGVLDSALDPPFPNTFAGLVEAVNYLTTKLAPNVVCGWQLNLWASPPGGYTGLAIPGQGLMHLTDGAASSTDFALRRQQIYAEAAAIAGYGLEAALDSWGADFVVLDKYGLDAGQQSGAAADPAGATWFWNLDQWNNYLEFCRALHDTTGLPVVLWQIPVGRINSSQAPDPYSSGLFPDLPNTNGRYEDSAPTFFLGDTFGTSGYRLTHFAQNLGADPGLALAGNQLTWGAHVAAARDVGIDAILFGAGVGISTDGVGNPPSDDFWWISRVQDYFTQPVPR